MTDMPPRVLPGRDKIKNSLEDSDRKTIAIDLVKCKSAVKRHSYPEKSRRIAYLFILPVPPV